MGRGKRRSGAGRVEEALPALSSLEGLPSFGEFSMSERQRAAFGERRAQLGDEGVAAEEVEPAFVARLDRYFPALVAASGTCRAEFSFRFGDVRTPSAAVGDWVVLRRPAGHDKGVIEFVLPRESDVARWRGGARGERQTLAANVDLVICVQALGERGVDANRVARSVVVAADCGAEAAVVLTKADRVSAEALEGAVARLGEVLGPAVRVVATSSAEGVGLEEVRRLVPAGVAAIVLGESGAGKSSLLNALLGAGTLETAAVRKRDDRGRHTTVARRMVSVPGGGVLVDEPGLRSLPLLGHEHGLALVFPEVEEAAERCRFRDCTHVCEPGCAVRSLVEEGELAQARLDVYLALAAEMRAAGRSLDPDVAR